MPRTTIVLPDDLKARSQRRARQLGVSLSELIRRSLQRELDRQPAEVGPDPLFAFDVVWDGEAPTDGAAKHDDYLYGDPD